MLFDTHCHLTDEKFEEDRAELLQRAADEGITEILIVGDTLERSGQALKMAGTIQTPRAFSAAGIHPHHARDDFPENQDALKALLITGKESGVLVAVGETGLDYHYDFSPRADQIMALEAQVEMACELELPLVLHCREAWDDFLAILQKARLPEKPGVVHCFSGGAHEAHQVLDLGFYIGLGGPVTFKKSEAFRDVVAGLPLNRLLVETDAPYLAPVPKRGKRNEPAFVVHTANCLAEIKGIPLVEAAETTRQNGCRLFGISR